MVVLHVMDVVHCTGSGVATVVPKYVEYQRKYVDVALYNLHTKLNSTNITTLDYSDYKTISSLPKPFCKPDIVVFHEIYKTKYLKLYKECLKSNIPYIIVPHGSLTNEAQNVKPLKKIIGNFLLFNKFINHAHSIQYLSESEKERSKAKKNHFIIGNGIDSTKLKNKPTNNKFIFLFIGRYSIYFKGIDIMLEACSLIKNWMEENNICIEMYGFGKQKKDIETLINRLNISNVCQLNNAVFDVEKDNKLVCSNVFIQPSRSEGQPMSIIEALSIGLPCLVTPGTTFYEYVKEKKCGYICQTNSKSIADAMKEAFYDNDRDVKSNNAVKNSKIDFSWDKISKNSIIEYKKVIRKAK